ncbi:MAG: response regulator transcription factor [Balneolaceae bacterium]|nr:response regulator transcription factor [Balneolaceae bacterium]
MKILLVEDELNVSRFIKKGLEEHGFSVDVAYDGTQGLKMAKSRIYDLIILDIVLPYKSGIDVCKEIRNNKNSVPVLMLTALGTLNDRVNGLDSGADDYLVKPFHFQELLARIRALYRRANSVETTDKIIKIDNLLIDLDSKEVRRGKALINLTAKEFRLLTLFAKNKGRVLSRNFIAEEIWEHSFDSGSNVIDVYVNYLRKKLDHGYEKKLLHTVIGMGYVLREQYEDQR